MIRVGDGASGSEIISNRYVRAAAVSCLVIGGRGFRNRVGSDRFGQAVLAGGVESDRGSAVDRETEVGRGQGSASGVDHDFLHG